MANAYIYCYPTTNPDAVMVNIANISPAFGYYDNVEFRLFKFDGSNWVLNQTFSQSGVITNNTPTHTFTGCTFGYSYFAGIYLNGNFYAQTAGFVTIRSFMPTVSNISSTTNIWAGLSPLTYTATVEAGSRKTMYWCSRTSSNPATYAWHNINDLFDVNTQTTTSVYHLYGAYKLFRFTLNGNAITYDFMTPYTLAMFKIVMTYNGQDSIPAYFSSNNYGYTDRVAILSAAYPTINIPTLVDVYTDGFSISVNNIGGSAEYDFRIRPPSGVYSYKSSVTNSYSIHDANVYTPNTKYYVSACALFIDNNNQIVVANAWSAELEITTGRPKIEAPTLTYTVTYNSISVVLSAVANASYYYADLYLNSTNALIAVYGSPTAGSYIFENLNSQTAYHIRVHASSSNANYDNSVDRDYYPTTATLIPSIAANYSIITVSLAGLQYTGELYDQFIFRLYKYNGSAWVLMAEHFGYPYEFVGLHTITYAWSQQELSRYYRSEVYVEYGGTWYPQGTTLEGYGYQTVQLLNQSALPIPTVSGVSSTLNSLTYTATVSIGARYTRYYCSKTSPTTGFAWYEISTLKGQNIYHLNQAHTLFDYTINGNQITYTGLMPNATYGFSIMTYLLGYNESQSYSLSASNNGDTWYSVATTKYTIINSPTISAITSNGFTVSWTNNPSVTRYSVHIVSVDGAFDHYYGSNTNTFVTSSQVTLSSSTTYDVSVCPLYVDLDNKGFSANNFGTFTQETTLVTILKLTNPTLSFSNIGVNSIAVTVSSVSHATNYFVYVYQGTTTPTNLLMFNYAGGVLSHTFTGFGLINNTLYDFTVYAIDSTAVYVNSDTTPRGTYTQTLLPIPTPTVPTSINVTQHLQTAYADISFVKGFNATETDIDYSGNGVDWGGVDYPSQSQSSYSLNMITYGTWYFRFRSRNYIDSYNIAYSLWTGTFSVTLIEMPKLSPPSLTFTSDTFNYNYIEVNMGTVANASFYYVYLWLNGVYQSRSHSYGAVPVNPYDFTGLVNNTEYEFRVQAVASSGYQPSDMISYFKSTKPMPVPAVPYGISVTQISNTTHFQVNYSINPDHVTGTDIDFTDNLADWGIVDYPSQSGTSYDINVHAFGTWYFRLRTVYVLDANNTSYSAWVTMPPVTIDSFFHVAQLTPVFITTYNSIQVTVSSVANAYYYYFELWLNGSQVTSFSTQATSATSYSYTFSGLTNAITYMVRVFASGTGTLHDSFPVDTNITTLTLPTPLNPSNVSIHQISNSTRIQLTFTLGDNATDTYVDFSNNSSNWGSIDYSASTLTSFVYDIGSYITGYIRLKSRTYLDANNIRYATDWSQVYTILPDPNASARPENWAWSYSISLGGNVYNVTGKNIYIMTYNEWNSFTSRINEFRNYKGFATYTFTTVSSGSEFTKTILNEALTAIREMYSSFTNGMTIPDNRVTGDNVLVASYFIDMRDALNSIL